MCSRALASAHGGTAKLITEAVADVHAEQTGKAIDEPPPAGVLDMAAVSVRNNRQRPVGESGHVGEVEQEVVVRGGLEVVLLELVVWGHRSSWVERESAGAPPFRYGPRSQPSILSAVAISTSHIRSPVTSGSSSAN